MRISKEILKELAGLRVGRGFVDEGKTYEVVENTLEDHCDWTVDYSQVIKVVDSETTNYFKTYYSVGASETQDQAPYEYEREDENGTLKVTEVFPKEVMTTVYVKK